MTLDTPENAYPTSLRVTDREFDITTSIDDRKFIDAEDYLRVPEKTDHFILYKTREATRKGIEIVLHTHRTLASFQANPFQKTIAKKTRPWLYDEEILNPEALNSLRLPPSEVADHEQIKKILGYDRLTEGDSLRFFNYVAGSKLDVPSEFWPVLLLWLRDELNHHKGFHAVYQHLFGFDNELETAIASEESDFNQFDTIMSDPFKLLVALVYDEASTINGYQHDIPVYELIGAPLVKFVKRVAADEG